MRRAREIGAKLRLRASWGRDEAQAVVRRVTGELAGLAGLAAGPPPHGSAERPAVFVGLANFAGSALAGYRHGPDAEIVQLVLA